MSWSLSLGKTAVEDFDAALDAQVEAQKPAAYNTDAEDSVAAAVAAAKALVASGVVGPAGSYVTASMSGHANPGHEPRRGYSLDGLSIRIEQQFAEG